MRVPRTVWAVLLANLACAPAARAGEEPAPPEVGFLEYLGLWQDRDEEWVVRAGWEGADTEAARRARELTGRATEERRDDSEPRGHDEEERDAN